MNYHQYSTPELVTTQLAQFIAEAVEATEGDFHLALSLEEHAVVDEYTEEEGRYQP